MISKARLALVVGAAGLVIAVATAGPGGASGIGAQVVGVWHGRTVLFPDTPAVPVTATFHGDSTLTISTITEVQPNPLLPGAKTPVQGVWERSGDSTMTAVGVWFDEGAGPTDPPAVGRVVFIARFDGDRDHLAGRALVEILPCTDLTSCPDPTVGIPSAPDIPGDTFQLVRLSA
jgi:hypothetical protein